MTDKLNELGKSLGSLKDDIKFSLERKYPSTPKIERSRDIFDAVIPFDMIFHTGNETAFTLDLWFSPPPKTATCCCGGCFCSICEGYSIGNTFTTTYPYYASSVRVYSVTASTGAERLVDRSDYTLTDSTTITSGFGSATVAFPVKICYVYREEGCTNP